jgi:hypothetical protein
MDGLITGFQNDQPGVDPILEQFVNDAVGLLSYQCHGNKDILMELFVYILKEHIAELTPKRIVLEYLAIGAIGIVLPNCVAHFFRIED